ncbi:unnamed protein product [Sphenostylis stenocarpa]|uniref:Late embryogenesis abundant protein LEA-2 subgroup domain-containing protein n=1 Tax=Sphenostylis stenocarpa TaxID=92480 RepID=A0AA86RWX9_9FABA|nr:unnamed protein product [Sphenostylis stenocarpa]
MASSITNVEPQNERGHVFRFSPLPRSETETDRGNHEHLSVSVESIGNRSGSGMSEYCYTQEIFSISERACEMIQDLLGLTLLMMLILLPVYKRLGTPKEDPIPPVLVLNSMYLSNFTTGSGGLAAAWDAKFRVTNTNVSTIYFRILDFTIFYKKNPEHALSVASSKPFYLEKGQYVKLHLKFTTGGENNETFVENWLAEEMGKDKVKDGSISFGMRVRVEAIYYGETWVSDVVMSPHCEDLTVTFLRDNDSGRLANPNRNFTIPIKWKPFSFF